MKRLALLVMLTLPIAGRLQSEEKCSCARYPFRPEPPCVKECTTGLLLEVDEKTLRWIGFPKPETELLLKEQPRLQRLACGDHGSGFGSRALPNYGVASKDLHKLLGDDFMNAVEAGFRTRFFNLSPEPMSKDDNSIRRELDVPRLNDTLKKLEGDGKFSCRISFR